jgi:hypothetical protein
MKRTFRALWARSIRGLETLPFIRLIQTHVLSSAGDGLVTVALAGSVFFNDSPTTARTRVALTLILTVAPFAVVAPFLGPAVDRARGGRRLVLLSASAARSLLCLLMASSLDSVALYPVAFLALVCSKTHAVAKSACVPELVEAQSALVRANSILAVGAVLAGFVAAAIGFAVSQLGGADWVLRVGALVFACAAALSLEVGGQGAEDRPAPKSETAKEILSSGVWRAATVMATLRACVGFLAFLIAFDLRRRGASTLWFGLAISAGMVGSSVGNVIAPRLRGHIREEWILVSSAILLCIASIAVTRGTGRLESSLLALILGICAAAAKLAFDSLVQRDAPAAVQGRSFARFEAMFQFVWVAGALVPVVLTITTNQGFWIIAIASAAASTWYLLAPKRKPSVV